MSQNKQFETFTKTVKCAKVGDSLNWLLVMPRITVFDDQQYGFPIGIAYVSSALKSSERNVFTLNMNYKKETVLELLGKVIEQNAIDIVATGGITTQYPLLKEILDSAKQVKPEIITVAGGGLITSEPTAAMTALQNADYGIIGEGEITICELAHALETGSDVGLVKGLVYRADGQWKITAPREEIEDLDMIPWPDYDGFEYEEMLSKTPIDVLGAANVNERLGFVFYSRSCPYNCTFCFHSSGKKYRTRSLDAFFEEFDWLMKRYSFDSIFFADEFFLRSLDFIREFCERIRPYGIRWSCSGRVDNITKEMLEILKEAGCWQIIFGVESVNDHILKSMRKHITRAQIENAFSLCYEVGIQALGNLIFGDLEETVEIAMDTINWWQTHQYWAITMHWIIAYPGSHVYKVSRERGIIPDPVQFIKDGCPEVNFSKMTDDERRQIASTIDMLINEGHDTLHQTTFSLGQSGKIMVTGDCPYCGKTCTFLNLDPIRPLTLETCAECHHTLRLYAIDYVNSKVFDKNIKNILKSHKVAIWPMITGLAKLFELSPSLQCDDVFLIDSSQYKQGTINCGKTIMSPDAIRDNSVDIVLVTVTTCVSAEIINRIKKDFPGVKKIALIGELFFESFNA